MSDNGQQQNKAVSIESLLSHNPLRLVRDLKIRLGDLDRRVTALDSQVGAAATQEQVHSLLTAQSDTTTKLLNSLNMNVLRHRRNRQIPLWRLQPRAFARC